MHTEERFVSFLTSSLVNFVRFSRLSSGQGIHEAGGGEGEHGGAEAWPSRQRQGQSKIPLGSHRRGEGYAARRHVRTRLAHAWCFCFFLRRSLSRGLREDVLDGKLFSTPRYSKRGGAHSSKIAQVMGCDHLPPVMRRRRNRVSFSS